MAASSRRTGVTAEAATSSALPFRRFPCHREYRDAKLAAEFEALSATKEGVASMSDSRAGAGPPRVCGFSHPIPCRRPLFTLRATSESLSVLCMAAKDGVGMRRHGPVCAGAGIQTEPELGTPRSSAG